jgi:photosystem II stability/assembly factor-like uncharacterized protein
MKLRGRVFISYRHKGVGSVLARIVCEGLEKRGFQVFRDDKDLGSGHFETALLKAIESATHVVVIATPGSLDECSQQGDWMRLEVAYAIKLGKNIVPVFIDKFPWPPQPLPEEVKALPTYNGIPYVDRYGEASLDDLAKLLRGGAKARNWQVLGTGAALTLAVVVAWIAWHARSHRPSQRSALPPVNQPPSAPHRSRWESVKWFPLAGPPARATALAMDPERPTTLLVGSGGALYKSLDQAGHWDPVHDSMQLASKSGEITSILFTGPGKALAATTASRSPAINSGGDVLESVGLLDEWASHSFMQTSFPVLEGAPVVEMEFCRGHKGRFLFAAAPGKGLLRLDDPARPDSKWTVVDGEAVPKSVRTVKYDPDRGIALAGTEDGLRLSRDEGETWSPVDALRGQIVTAVAIDPERGDLWAGSHDPESDAPKISLLLSRDAGRTWITLINSPMTSAVSVIRVSPPLKTVFVGLGARLLRVDPDTLQGTWSEEFPFANASGVPAGFSIRDIVVGPGGDSMFLATDRGVLRSLDKAKTWEDASEGLTQSAVGPMLVLPQGRGLLVGRGGRVFRYSTSNGRWEDATFGIHVGLVTAIVRAGGRLVLGTISGRNGTMFVSEDEGITWKLLKEFLDDPVFAVAQVEGSGTLLAGVKKGVYSSADGGKTWQLKSTTAYVTRLASISGKPSNVVGVSSSEFSSSLSQGALFPFLFSAEGGEARALHLKSAVGQQEQPVIINRVRTTVNSFLLCTDAGLYQLDAGGELRSILGRGRQCLDVVWADDRTVIVAGSRTISLSQDGGRTWSDLGEGLPTTTTVTGMEWAEDRIYVATQGAGVFVSRFVK